MRDDRPGVAPAVEELLRFLSIVHSGVPRVATRGHRHRRATRSPRASSWSSRCPAPTATPRRRGPGPARRPARRRHHVAFGHGVHHCLGAPLARMEMAIAFPALLRRFPTLALAIPFDEVEFRSASVVHGLGAARHLVRSRLPHRPARLPPPPPPVRRGHP